jgi:hypothetical protein
MDTAGGGDDALLKANKRIAELETELLEQKLRLLNFMLETLAGKPDPVVDCAKSKLLVELG